ncbi:MAG: nickel-dependent hydrogenase large subunit [Campylobacterales bacterium]
MQVTYEVLARIEGEATWSLGWQDGRIVSAQITFPNVRGFERILQGRPAWDALVITPRVCGICGQAHQLAAARAIEAVFIREGREVELSSKANEVRLILSRAERLQSHLKWAALTLLPLLGGDQETREDLLEGASKLARMMALLAGQYPHSSAMIPGGTTYHGSVADYVRGVVLAREIDQLIARPLAFLNEACQTSTILARIPGVAHPLLVLEARKGIVDGQVIDLEPEDISIHASPYGKALPVRIGGRSWEVGPVARAALRLPEWRERLACEGIRAKDRIVARLEEISLDASELHQSWQRLAVSSGVWDERANEKISGEGWGVVEAARGSLAHYVRLDDGMIQEYRLVTPTQWNLGPSLPDSPSVAEEALIGLHSPDEAEFVIRSFDLCAVCTTH